ncbi:MAG: molybdopterin-guanine dinucleotide biosynthesis protein B [Anaerolineae bacterium]|nr:molybdopterin-guanine dinucleotide biosynthesis protein B [Caldilineales bacterium]MDW8268538.1 molybdopterin-guanine dinucleotide biosynthesis protein B [Anaerolineae bacterium]
MNPLSPSTSPASDLDAVLAAVQALPPQALSAVVQAALARLRPPVVSVVARSGTGKTTFLEALVRELMGRGLRVGVLKHHAHPTPFDTPGKDTYRLAEAGAAVVIGVGPVEVAVFRREGGAERVDAVITREAAGLDLVLTEGYRRGPYPKIELHRSTRSDTLLCQADELLALVSDRRWLLAVPQFGWEDTAGVADFLVAWRAGHRG